MEDIESERGIEIERARERERESERAREREKERGSRVWCEGCRVKGDGCGV